MKTPDRRAWNIITLSDARLDDILQLLATSLSDSGATRKTPAFWSWKHQYNPFGPSLGLAAVDGNDKLVGLRPFMRWRLSEPKGEVLAVRAVDTVTDQHWRGRGIFSRLTIEGMKQLKSDGIQLIFNTPNANSRPGNLKLGWRVVERMPIYMTVLQPLRMVTALLARWPKEECSLPGWEAVSRGGVISWHSFTEFDEFLNLVGVSETIRGYHGYRTSRTAEYLNWRYREQPNIDYGVFCVDGANNRLEAAAVLRLERRLGLLGGLITDLFVRDGSKAVGVRLLKALRRDLRVDYLIAHVGLRAPERAMLRRAWFLPMPLKGIVLMAREVGAIDTLPLDPFLPEHWDLTLGELELF